MNLNDKLELATSKWLLSQDVFNITSLCETFPFIGTKLAEEEMQFWIKKEMIVPNGSGYKVIKENIKDAKIVFLDVDGVLNHNEANDALDEECVKNLVEIIKKSSAIIVLISSWKAGWFEDNKYRQDDDANYLDKVFNKHGISISHKSSRHAFPRLFEVIDYLMKYCTDQYIIIDDDEEHYRDTPVYEHLIHTCYYNGGLTKELKERAICLLK